MRRPVQEQLMKEKKSVIFTEAFEIAAAKSVARSYTYSPLVSFKEEPVVHYPLERPKGDGMHAPLPFVAGETTVQWFSDCEAAFKEVKEKKILTHFIPGLPLKLFNDACDYGCWFSNHVIKKPITLASRT
ncbi:hypothetical protein JTB14_013388 [Gonioctena quinquepunctata]|nr:hypothetical protein JTB14_013388 [Gonioctena quinquepunctata]